MKTYARKKVGDRDDVIVNLDELCRLCLAREEQLLPIFNDNEPIPLPIRIMACVALEVLEDDGLPSMICHPCHYQLEKYYVFRKKCENSDLKLRSHLRKLGDNSKSDEESDTINSDHQFVRSSVTLAIAEENEIELDDYETASKDQPESSKDDSITLTQELNKNQHTLKKKLSNNPISELFVEAEQDEEEEMDDECQDTEEDNNLWQGVEMDAVAAAVRASLIGGSEGEDDSLSVKLISPPEGTATHVEVTTKDGAVLLMELTIEEQEQDVAQSMLKVDENGELMILQCPECPKTFARKAQLRRHSSVHYKQRGMSCDVCDKWFPSRSALIRHMRIHTGEKPFQCNVCKRSFAQKEILYRHFIVHSEIKPYECKVCGKGFTQKESCKVHQKNHNQPRQILKLHKCFICPKIFCHASGLSRHLLTHAGRVYKCLECDKCFNDKSSLRRHHRITGHQSLNV